MGLWNKNTLDSDPCPLSFQAIASVPPSSNGGIVIPSLAEGIQWNDKGKAYSRKSNTTYPLKNGV